MGVQKTKTARLHLDMWTTIATVIFLGYLLFLIYPLSTVVINAFQVDGAFSVQNFVTFFTSAHFLEVLANSFKVGFCVMLCSVLLGSVLAYLFAMFDFKGKAFLRVLIMLASMSPPFVGAYSWILLMGRKGVISQFLNNVLHISGFSIYGFAGIVFVLTLQTFPFVFMYVSGALRHVDSSLLEASESMGVVGIRRFFKVVFPLLMPSVAASALLVFMGGFADFGTPMLIGEGFRTLPVEIFSSFNSEVGTNAGFAAAMSMIAILIALGVFLVQQLVSNRFSFSMNSLHPITAHKAKPISRIFLYLFVYGIIAIAILPQCYVVYTSFLKTSGSIFVPGYSLESWDNAFNMMGDVIANTIMIPLIALVCVLILGTFIAYMALRHKNVMTKLVDTLNMIPYVIPGTVMGVAFIGAFNNGIADSGFMILAGTITIIVVSLTLRRLPYTVRSAASSLRQIPRSMEEAAQSLGASKMTTFVKIVVPLMAPGIISGGILTWITMISELSTSVLLCQTNTMTMPVAIFNQVLRGNYGDAAALATILMGLTVLSLALFTWVTRKKK